MEKQKNTRRRPPKFELVAGQVCLDFVNTLDDRFSAEPKELLKSYLDLARFGEDTQILSPSEVDHLFELSQSSPDAAKRALGAAIQMREAVSSVFWALLHKKPVPPAALFTLNQYIQMVAQHSNLVQTKAGFEWRFDAAGNHFDAPLWPIARSAADLLASAELAYVRACDSPTCQWLFLDMSKNHKRRWCDMTKCGNRAKFRSFYARQKKSG